MTWAVVALVATAPCAKAGNPLADYNFAKAASDSALWHIPNWTPDGATFAGRTQFRVAQSSGLPRTAAGGLMLEAQSYNPSGFSFLADEVISNRRFALGQGLDISYRARLDPAGHCGMVGGLFVYAQKPGGGVHDEIDFELLSNVPGQVQTNIYGNEPLGVGRPLLAALPAGTVGDAHVYEIRWTARMVTWLVDGKALRSVGQGLPAGPVGLYANVWAPAVDWPRAFCAASQPVRRARDNVVLARLELADVRVEGLGGGLER